MVVCLILIAEPVAIRRGGEVWTLNVYDFFPFALLSTSRWFTDLLPRHVMNLAAFVL
jgi:hypothetical protein